MSHVEARAVPHGKQAAGFPLKNLVPRTPLGPSVQRREGTERRGIAFVCQKSIPEERCQMCLWKWWTKSDTG